MCTTSSTFNRRRGIIESTLEKWQAPSPILCRDGDLSADGIRIRRRSRESKANTVAPLAIACLILHCFVLGYMLRDRHYFQGSVGLEQVSIRTPDEPNWIEEFVPSIKDSDESGRSDGSPKLNTDERYKILSSPDGWKEFSFKKIRSHFKCQVHAKSQLKPLFQLDEWQHIRAKYNEVAGGEIKFDDVVPPTLGYALHDNVPPPYYANYSPGKGRGIFASRNIEKGELVHDGKLSAVIFVDAAAWRRYVFSLPREMACDISEWSWTQRLARRGPFRVLVDLNIAAFFNSGGSKMSNVMPRSATELEFFATRDIEKDEELLYDYRVYKTKWEEVGL